MNTQGVPADGRALPVCGEPSAAVMAAQERLLELRRKLALERGRLGEKGGRGAGEQGRTFAPTAESTPSPDPSQSERDQHALSLRERVRERDYSAAQPCTLGNADSSGERRIQSASPCPPASLPPVAELAQRLAAGGALGWHSETLTRHLRVAAARATNDERRLQSFDEMTRPEEAPSPNPSQREGDRNSLSGRDRNSLSGRDQNSLSGRDRNSLSERDRNSLSPRERAGERVSPALERAGERVPSALESPDPSSPATRYEIRDTSEESALHSYLVRVYPDLALAMLRHKAAAAGRVWLLLRGLDATGTGRVPVADAARRLTTDGSPAHICGRRQLANLLKAGDGLYWQRDRGRDGAEVLRLASAARVAAALGVRRLGGRPVGVPLTALTGSIGQTRAQLYAAFHSGRTQTDLLTGRRRAHGPIARETLCKLSGVSRNSQRTYERRAGVGRRAAFALGPAIHSVGAGLKPAPTAGLEPDPADEHEIAWRRGRALFHYRDAAGRYGRPGAVYLAWQLPNEYTGPHATLSRGHQKRLNRDLADLFLNGMTGNGERNGEGASGQWSVVSNQWVSGSAGQSPLPPRRFYNSAKAAYLARHNGEKYWRQGQMWLMTNHELGITNEEQVTRAKDSSFVIRNF